jgi:hypothetical protein
MPTPCSSLCRCASVPLCPLCPCVQLSARSRLFIRHTIILLVYPELRGVTRHSSLATRHFLPRLPRSARNLHAHALLLLCVHCASVLNSPAPICPELRGVTRHSPLATSHTSTPSPFFRKDMILKHLPGGVCKRCDSKRLITQSPRRGPVSPPHFDVYDSALPYSAVFGLTAFGNTDRVSRVMSLICRLYPFGVVVW